MTDLLQVIRSVAVLVLAILWVLGIILNAPDRVLLILTGALVIVLGESILISMKE